MARGHLGWRVWDSGRPPWGTHLYPPTYPQPPEPSPSLLGGTVLRVTLQWLAWLPGQGLRARRTSQAQVSGF